MCKLADILQEIRPECDFSSSTNFIADGLLDSFDVVSLVTELDSAFSISIDGTDILPENFRSVPAIHDLLARHGVKL